VTKAASKLKLTKWDLHVYNPKTETTTTFVREYAAEASMSSAPAVVMWASRDLKVPQRYILALPHRG
jgi:hypothetical protein